MADFDVRFPPKISLTAVGGPRFKTSIAIMASGTESRTQEWENDRGEWVVGFSARLPRDWMPMVSFFRVIAKGSANTFRFKDWTDYLCASGEGFFISDVGGSPAGVQMVKRYTFDGFTYDRIIAKPISGTITTDAVGLNYGTGIAASGTTWSGEFDVWARLNNDPMKCQVINRNPEEGLIVGWDGIEIVEVIHEEL